MVVRAFGVAAGVVVVVADANGISLDVMVAFVGVFVFALEVNLMNACMLHTGYVNSQSWSRSESRSWPRSQSWSRSWLGSRSWSWSRSGQLSISSVPA